MNGVATKILLEAKDIAELTGLTKARAYRLMHMESMPVVTVGNRLYMHRDKFLKKLEEYAESGIPLC